MNGMTASRGGIGMLRFPKRTYIPSRRDAEFRLSGFRRADAPSEPRCMDMRQ